LMNYWFLYSRLLRSNMLWFLFLF